MRREKLYERRNGPIEIGARYGRLIVLERTNIYRGNKRLYRCLCDCGKEILISSHHVGRGALSCGCYRTEFHTFHNKCHHRLYEIWCGMKERCNNPKNQKYKNYGGRGIKICEEWNESFDTFYSWALAHGWNEKLNGREQSIDRIDVNGNYEPSNCRFANDSLQMMNRRPMGKVGYVGISKDKTGYRATVTINGRNTYIGHSTDIKTVVNMRNQYIIEHNLPNKINVYRD